MGTLKRNYGFSQKWRNEAVAQLVSTLTDLGQEVCKKAIENKGYTDRLYNLHDSIGSAVYVGGEIVPSSKRYAESKKSRGEYFDRGDNATYSMMTGRQALDDYWNEHPRLSGNYNSVELVVIAAVFYAGILEDRGIEVMSVAAEYIENEMQKYQYKSYKPKLRAFSDGVSI